jgi:hypothetical protein
VVANEDALLSFAEIAAAFAGFAALVTALRRDRLGESAPLAVSRLRVVVLASLVVVFAAMIPVVLSRYQLSEPSIWRASSFLALFVNFVAVVAVQLWNRGVDYAHHTASSVVISVLAVFTLGPLLLMAFGAFPALASGLYFTFMGFALAQAAFSFILVLDALISRESA